VDVPIALDESVRGPREALAAAKAGACDIFVVKLMKTGGILNALKVNAIAEAAGISVMMGNMGESSLGLAAHFHLNVALANATHGDADLTWRPGGYARDIGNGLRTELRDGVSTVLVPDGPGLGIVLDEDAVVAQRVARRW
jgi:L-alanine-DL-glutamate epimerase-like enolase superfamily enzyme